MRSAHLLSLENSGEGVKRQDSQEIRQRANLSYESRAGHADSVTDATSATLKEIARNLLHTTFMWGMILWEVNERMIAYSRGSERLAGAASLKYRVPAMIWSFRRACSLTEERQPVRLEATGSTPVWRPLSSSMVEQQTDNLRVAGSNPALSPTHCE